MAETFGMEIYASNKLFFTGRAKSLVFPAVDGEQTFLAHHSNMVCAIIPGELRFEDEAGKETLVAVSSGFVEMINNRVKVFCFTVERPRTLISEERRKPRRGQKSSFGQKQSIQEYHMNQMALARAMTRLRVTKKQDV